MGWGGVGVEGVQMAPRFGHFQGVCDNSTSCLLQNKTYVRPEMLYIIHDE